MSLYTEKIDEYEFLVAEINARKCTKKGNLDKEIRKVFMLPENPHYKNHTTGDNIADLELYHTEKKYKIIMKKFNTVDEKEKNNS